MKALFSFTVLGSCLLCFSLNANATNFFNWGIETDSTSVPSLKNLGFMGATRRSSDTAHSGKYSMKLVVTGNDSGNQQMGADLGQFLELPFSIVGSPAIYYRWWMKIMPGFSWGNGTYKTKTSRLIGTTAPGADQGKHGYTGFMAKDNFHIEIGSPDITMHVPYNVESKADGKWHEYIAMVKANSTLSSNDAKFKVWVDGSLVGQVNNFTLYDRNSSDLFAEAWAGWMVTPYFQLNGTASDGGVIYIDDISTDDQWNSTIAAGSPAANTPTPLAEPLPPIVK